MLNVALLESKARLERTAKYGSGVAAIEAELDAFGTTRRSDEAVVDLKQLLSGCVSLCQSAMTVIREVQREREAGIALESTMKDPTDSRTYLTKADTLAQRVIVDGLRAMWPHVAVVGEEEDGEAGESSSSPAAIDTALCNEMGVPEDLQRLVARDLCIFVDPVDGTREFVEGRLEAVECLLGIAYRGRSIAGVMGLPFYDDALTVPAVPSHAEGRVLYGIAGGSSGVMGVRPGERCGSTRDRPLVLAASAGCKNPTLRRVRETIAATSLLEAGGSANKVLAVIMGQADVALLNLATSKWDSCATEAVLAAAGGTVTTLLGWPIEHTPEAPTPNPLGVLCTCARYEAVAGRSHADLCAGLRCDGQILQGLLPGEDLQVPREGRSAVDLARGIDGELFTARELSVAVCGEAGGVVGYTVPEGECVRYKQSHACRIHLHLHPGSTGLPGSCFYKRIVLRELPYAMYKHKHVPFKVGRWHCNRTANPNPILL